MINPSEVKLVILNDLSWAKGGASALSIENARLMVDAGFNVVFMSADGKTNAELEKIGVQCLTVEGEAINPDKPLQGMVNGLHNARAAQFLKRWIANNDTAKTVYHLHGWSKIWSPAIFGVLEPVADRLVLHGHDYFPVCPNGAFVHYPSNNSCELTPCRVKCLLSACDQRNYVQKIWRFARGSLRNHWLNFAEKKSKVILLHPSMKPFYLRGSFREDQLLVIPNPVKPYSLEKIAAEKNSTFTFIGRLVPEKGADIFLEAAKQASVNAKVIGDGPELEKLKANFPEAQFIGWQDSAGISQHLKSTRVVVMPSRLRETFGLAAVASVASGVPAIVSEHSAVAADFVRLEMGMMLSTENTASWAHAMREVSQNDAAVQTMSQRGAEHWQAVGLTMTQWQNQLANLYLQMLER